MTDILIYIAIASLLAALVGMWRVGRILKSINRQNDALRWTLEQERKAHDS